MHLVSVVLAVLSSISVCALAQQQVQQTLDNTAIAKMSQAKVPTDVIIRTIEESQDFNFSLLPADLVALKQWGVADDVIRAMAAKQSGRSSGTAMVSPKPTPSSASPTPSAPPVPERPSIPVQAPALPEPAYLSSGMWELGLEGNVLVPHASASDVEGLASLRLGRLITDGNEIGVDTTVFLQRNVQDVFLSGFYRYNFGAGGDNRLIPFVGAGAGVNVFNISDFDTESNFLARGEVGLKYFVKHHVALDVAYNLLWVRVKGASFKDSSFSVATIGFSYVF